MLRSSRRSPGLTRMIAAVVSGLSLILLALSCSRSLTTTLAPNHARASRSAGALASTAADGGPELVVTLAPGVAAADVASDYGAVVTADEAAAQAAALEPGAGESLLSLQQQLATDPRVLSAEPNAWLETAESRQQSFAFDDGFGSPEAFAEQPAAEAANVDAAHEVATGRGVTVAILDTGIDPWHPLLRRAYAGGVDLVDGDDLPAEQANGVDDDGDGFTDEAFGHGTHVAGIVHLVAPDARLLVVRVLNDDGRGSLLSIVTGVRWAVEHGAKIINLSLGTLDQSDALQLALADAEAQGVVIITSAGNWGDDQPVEFPARSSHVAAIAAVDATARPAEFSSFGDIVALSAPGVGVRSTYPGGGYRLWSGTSMSAPFVAGTCALLAQVHPEWTLADMLTRIGRTAGRVREDGDKFGAGALDAGAALAPDRREPAEAAPIAEELRPH